MKTKIRPQTLWLYALLGTILLMSIGYASINSITMDIEGTATAMAQEGIFITDVQLVDSKNIDEENTKIVNIYKTMLQSNIALSNSTIDTYLTYEITVYNSTDANYYFVGTIYEGLYTNDNIIFELKNIKEGDILTSTNYKKFMITFKYKTTEIEDNTLKSYIDFTFKKGYSVAYENIEATKYPNYAVANETFNVAFETLANPIEVSLNGQVLSSSDYTYSNYNLTIPNVKGDIKIRMLNRYTITNLVTNGSFEDGLNNWTIRSGDTNSWLVMNITRSGSYGAARVATKTNTTANWLAQSINWTSGHKYYYYAFGMSETTQNMIFDVNNKGRAGLPSDNSLRMDKRK